LVDATGAFNHGMFTTNGSEVMHVIHSGLRHIETPVAQLMWLCNAESYRQQKKRERLSEERANRNLGGPGSGCTGTVLRGDLTASNHVDELWHGLCRASRHTALGRGERKDGVGGGRGRTYNHTLV